MERPGKPAKEQEEKESVGEHEQILAYFSYVRRRDDGSRGRKQQKQHNKYTLRLQVSETMEQVTNENLPLS